MEWSYLFSAILLCGLGAYVYYKEYIGNRPNSRSSRAAPHFHAATPADIRALAVNKTLLKQIDHVVQLLNTDMVAIPLLQPSFPYSALILAPSIKSKTMWESTTARDIEIAELIVNPCIVGRSTQDTQDVIFIADYLCLDCGVTRRMAPESVRVRYTRVAFTKDGGSVIGEVERWFDNLHAAVIDELQRWYVENEVGLCH